MTEQEKKSLEASQSKWEKEVRAPYIEKNPERRKFVTDIGIEIQNIYTPLDLEKRGFEYEKDVGYPGQEPWTRGITPNMNRSGKMDDFTTGDMVSSVYVGFGLPEHVGERIKKLVSWGCDRITLAADLPTQVGYDSDHMMARGEIGRSGVCIDSLQDLEIMFDGVAIDELKGGLGYLGNSFGPFALASWIALGRKKGLEISQYRITLQNDPIKEFFARGTYIYPMDAAVHLACDVYEWCAKNAPHWNGGFLCSSHINGSGTGSLKAAAYAMLDGFVYLDDLLSRGLTLEEIAPVMNFFFDEREDFFVTAALYRASRKLWAKLLRKYYNAKTELATQKMMMGYPHGGETLQEPLNNIVRIGLACAGFYLGGATIMECASYDEAMGTPNEQSHKICLRTEQIVHNELGLHRTVDPLAGSYYVESLTIDIANEMEAEIEKVRTEYGDIKGAIEAGYCQSVATRGAIRRQEAVEGGERLSVGMNLYPTDEPLPKGALRINNDIEAIQIERLKKLKATRDNKAVEASLAKVRKCAEEGTNCIEVLVEAVQNYATIGEVCDVWREIYGEYQPISTF